MCILLDQAIDEWNSLAKREGSTAYRVQTSSSTLDVQDGKPPRQSSSTHMNSVHSYPTEWREKICEWCFQVIDYSDIDRDVIGISLSYFDRYISCLSSIIDETTYKLVAMSSLHLALKVHSSKKITAHNMATLSKGLFQEDQILKMERCIIESLSWFLNPPTASMFLHVANPLVEASTIDPQVSYKIAELSRYLVEISVCESYFTDKQPSSIAYASILVAMEYHSIPVKIMKKFCSYHLDESPNITVLCAKHLCRVYGCLVDEELPCTSSSPICVINDLPAAKGTESKRC